MSFFERFMSRRRGRPKAAFVRNASAPAPFSDLPVTPMEALAAQFTDESIAEDVGKGTREGYAIAFACFTLRQSLHVLQSLRGEPDLHEALSRNNPDVVLYNLAALLLRRTVDIIEETSPEAEERLNQQVIDVALVVGRLFKEYSDFDKADEGFPYRMLIFRGDDAWCMRALAIALTANAGHATPMPVGSMRKGEVEEPAASGVEAIRSRLLGNGFLPGFIAQAAEFARKLDELDREVR